MTTVSTALDAAFLHHQSGEIKQTEDLCRLIIRIDPSHPDALYLLGVSAHQQGRTDEALSYIGQAISAGGAEAPFQKKLGSVFRSLNRIDDAIESYEETVRLKPDDVETLLELGALYYESGKLDEAKRCYTQGLNITPNAVDVQMRLGKILIDQNLYDDAVKQFRQAIQLRPDCAEIHYQLAEACVQAGRLDEATASFRESQHLNPGLIDSQHRWRVVLRALEKVDELSRTIQQYSKVAANSADQKIQPNEVLKLRRELDETIHLYEESFSIQSRADEILEHTAGSIIDGNWNYNSDSVPHLEIENAFPNDFYLELLENFPEDRFFLKQHPCQANVPDEARDCRFFNLLDASIESLPEKQRMFWLHFSAMFYAEKYRWTLFSKFRQQIPPLRQVFLVRGMLPEPGLIQSYFPEQSVVIRWFLIQEKIQCFPEILLDQESADSEITRTSTEAQLYLPNSGYVFESATENSAEISIPHQNVDADSLLIIFSEL